VSETHVKHQQQTARERMKGCACQRQGKVECTSGKSGMLCVAAASSLETLAIVSARSVVSLLELTGSRPDVELLADPPCPQRRQRNLRYRRVATCQRLSTKLRNDCSINAGQAS